MAEIRINPTQYNQNNSALNLMANSLNAIPRSISNFGKLLQENQDRENILLKSKAEYLRNRENDKVKNDLYRQQLKNQQYAYSNLLADNAALMKYNNAFKEAALNGRNLASMPINEQIDYLRSIKNSNGENLFSTNDINRIIPKIGTLGTKLGNLKVSYVADDTVSNPNPTSTKTTDTQQVQTVLTPNQLETLDLAPDPTNTNENRGLLYNALSPAIRSTLEPLTILGLYKNE